MYFAKLCVLWCIAAGEICRSPVHQVLLTGSVNINKPPPLQCYFHCTTAVMQMPYTKQPVNLVHAYQHTRVSAQWQSLNLAVMRKILKVTNAVSLDAWKAVPVHLTIQYPCLLVFVYFCTLRYLRLFPFFQIKIHLFGDVGESHHSSQLTSLLNSP